MAAKPCLFCRIAAGEEAAHRVYEDERFVAFLDVRPLFPGHTLLVPREHHEAIWDLPRELGEQLTARVQRVSVAVRDAMGAAGIFTATNNIVSQSVPHLHVHVVPRWSGDTNFMPVVSDTKVLPEMLAETYRTLRPAFDELAGETARG